MEAAQLARERMRRSEEHAPAAVAARRPSPAIARLSIATGVLVALQLTAGVVNLVLLAPVWMQLETVPAE